MASSADFHMIEFLDWLAYHANLSGPLQSDVRTLRSKVYFLEVLLNCKGKWHIEDANLKILLTRINTVFQIADMELRKLWADLKRLCPHLDLGRLGFPNNSVIPVKMVDVLSGMLERLQLLTPDIQQVYTVLSNSSRSVTYFNDDKAALKTLRRLMHLLYRKAELKAVQDSLEMLRDFIGFTSMNCRKLGKLKDLLIHAESLVDNISCLLYVCCPVNENMNDEMVKEIKMQLSSELQRFSPAQLQVRDIYIKALKTLKSELGIFDARTFCSFLGSVKKLSSMTSNKSQIAFLCEEPRLLSTFIDESSAQEQMCNFLRDRIAAVIIDAACAIIYLLSDDEQNRGRVREVKMAVYDLQHIFMLERENAAKADCIYLQTPWRFLGPNAWGEIGSQLEFLEEQRSGPLWYQIQMVRKELLPLNKAFSKFTAVQTHIEIHRRRLIRIIDRANFVITSFEYGVVTLWSCKLELYYLIQKIRMIRMEVRDTENRFINKQLSNESKKLPILSIVGMLEFEDQLRCLETNMDLTSPLKDEVRILRLKASFLRVFLNCRGKWHIEDANLKVILTRIQTVLKNSDLRKLWADFIQIESAKCWGMPMNMASMLSSMQEKLQLLDPDIQEVYTILSKSSRFITGMTDEAITESLNTLLENIEDLLGFNVELVSPVKDELEAVKKCLSLFRDYLCFMAKMCSKLGKLKDLLIHAEILVDNISCVLYLCSVNDKLNDQMVKEMKIWLPFELQKFSPAWADVRESYIKTLKALESAQGNSTLVDDFLGFLDSLGDYILELSGTKTWSTTPVKDQILLLQEDLPFLITYFAMDLSLEEHIENDHRIFKDLLERTSAAINEIGYVIGSLRDDKQNYICKKISDFLARKFYDFSFPRSFRSNIPRINRQGFIGYLVGNLKVLLNTKADLVAPLKDQIEIVQEELLSVGEDFSKTAKKPDQFDVFQSQWIRFIETAYHTEYVIDSYLLGRGTLAFHKLVLINVLKEIKTIKMELKAIDDKIIDEFSTEANSPKTNAVLSSKQRLTEEKYSSELVIFLEAAKEIIDQLTYGSEKLSFLSIVGMPGIGKTTLANSVFKDSSVNRRFHVRARCSVSQVFNKERLLREILQEIGAESYQCKDVCDLENKLRQSLKGRRYLIFIDDIWDIQPWEEIRNSFPDDGNGSRIMFTSRFDNIASQAGPASINYHLSPLSEDKSWKMLESRVFGDGRCPIDLVTLGREIAANCKGLPLTVDLIAGNLRGKSTIREWEEVANSMKEYLHDPQGRCQEVLELSYQNLPDALRPCFLYFAAFPEDTNIRTRDLILLWIAEGFIQLQKDDHRCLEDVAERMLNILINRSLVTVWERRSLGGVKSTRIHDLLRNFALAKAKEERFMLKIDDSTLSCDDYQWRKQYRLCFYDGDWCQFHESNISSTCARVLILSGHFSDFSSLRLTYFKLLRVLYIHWFNVCYHPTILFTLIHLRFLLVPIFNPMILSEIHKLWNLETFILMIGKVPSDGLCLDKICNMKRLRHFCSSHCVDLKCHTEKILEKSFQFDNLRTLYHVKVSYADDIEMIFKLMPNLVKLKVKFYNPDGGRYSFPKLDFLKKLESLEVDHQCKEYPCKIINFPPYLKTLVLSRFRMPWTEIFEIGRLENLEILKLRNGAFEGAIWDMIDGQFPKLKCLSLSHLDIEEWNATEDHLSCLEQLHVESCEKLKELPPCLAEIATLQKIKLFHCHSSARRSAKMIEEEQKDAGNHQLVVETEEARTAIKWG